MSRLDLVIFGATGFTGKHVVTEIVRIAKDYPAITWAIAGRSREKLESVLQWVSAKVGEDVSSVQTILADVEDESSLRAMCDQAKVVVNCCGPYRLYGEPVVRAAIDCKTHYVDVCGEPQFMELMQLEYDKGARAAGVFVISACGFDSIPADLGIVFLEERFDGILNSVELYISLGLPKNWSGNVVNYGTWESAVYCLANMEEWSILRKKLFPQRLPMLKPKLQQRLNIHNREGSWCLPVPFLDVSVVHRTQRRLYDTERKRPVQFKAHVKLPNLLAAFPIIFAAAVLFFMSKFSFTRQLLLDYPAVFTFGMVTRAAPKEDVVVPFTFELIGTGWHARDRVENEPTKEVIAKVSAIDGLYKGTAVMLLHSAITILTEKDKMPATCGVVTPGAAFRHTSIVQRLIENKIHFEIVNQMI